MILLIASDIHGCASAAKKLVRRFEDEHADSMLILGDILYHGPRNALPDEYDTKETARVLNELKDKIAVVRGNCDAEVDQCMLEFPIFEDYRILEMGTHRIFATHGHHFGPDKLPPMGSGDILMCGHTHVPGYAQIGDMLYCNPGSTSIPKGGSGPSYLVFDGETFLWKRLETGEVYSSYSFKE